MCEHCGQAISLARLQALPATRLCVDCARRQEEPSAIAVEEEVPRSGRIHADMSLTTERELESAIRDQVREDGRVDMEELRLVCRHGVVYLEGALPSEEQHRILLQLVQDFVGLEDGVRDMQSQGERLRFLDCHTIDLDTALGALASAFGRHW